MAVFDVLGSKHLHIRNQTLSFDEVFVSLKKSRDGGQDISRISIYCDQLDCSSNATGDERDGRLAVYTVGFKLTHLFIYARSFLTFSPIDSLRLADSFGLTISLYYDICNPTIVLQLAGDQRLGVCWQGDMKMVLEDQGRWRPEILQEDGEARLQATGVLGLRAYEARCQSAGREIRCRGPNTPPIVRLLRNVPPLELDAGSSPQRLSMPTPRSLPLTVRMIFDLAVRQTTTNSRLSSSVGEIANSEIISRLRFVVTCCRRSVTHGSLVDAAKRLLRSLHPASNYSVHLTGVESTRLQVPWPGPATLKTALALVETVEADNRDLSLTAHIDEALEAAVHNIQNNIRDLQEVVTKQFNQIQQSLETATNTVIKAIAETVPSEKDLEGLQADAKDARSNAAKSEAAMESMQAQVQTASERLNKGIKKYQEEAEKKFIVDCVLSAIEITASLAITVASAGAGGPARTTAEMAAITLG